MKLLCKTAICVLSFVSLNTAAKNANQFSYIGINFQKNSYDDLNLSPNIDTTQLTPLKYDEKTSESGYRGLVGYQFNRYIAVETGITSFGKASFSLEEDQTDTNGNITQKTIQGGEFSTLAADIRAIGTYPINNSLFIKAQVGILAWNNDMSILVEGVEGFSTQKESDSGVSLLTGLGVGYGFNDSMAITFDFERTEIAEITTKILGVSLLVRF